MVYGIFYCSLCSVKVAAGQVHWKGKSEWVRFRMSPPAGRNGAGAVVTGKDTC